MVFVIHATMSYSALHQETTTRTKETCIPFTLEWLLPNVADTDMGIYHLI